MPPPQQQTTTTMASRPKVGPLQHSLEGLPNQRDHENFNAVAIQGLVRGHLLRKKQQQRKRQQQHPLPKRLPILPKAQVSPTTANEIPKRSHVTVPEESHATVVESPLLDGMVTPLQRQHGFYGLVQQVVMIHQHQSLARRFLIRQHHHVTKKEVLTSVTATTAALPLDTPPHRQSKLG